MDKSVIIITETTFVIHGASSEPRDSSETFRIQRQTHLEHHATSD